MLINFGECKELMIQGRVFPKERELVVRPTMPMRKENSPKFAELYFDRCIVGWFSGHVVARRLGFGFACANPPRRRCSRSPREVQSFWEGVLPDQMYEEHLVKWMVQKRNFVLVFKFVAARVDVHKVVGSFCFLASTCSKINDVVTQTVARALVILEICAGICTLSESVSLYDEILESFVIE